MTKLRTARAVAGNQGVQREFARRLNAVLRKVLREALADMRKDAEAVGLAQDAAGDAVSGYLADRFAERMARWMIKAGEEAEKVSRWFCAQMYRTTTSAQKKALEAAGMSEKAIDIRWKVPLLKRQYISPTAAKRLAKDIADNTGLITKMASQDLARLQAMMSESAGRNVNFDDIEKLLESSQGFDTERAKRVALDQTNKLNQQIQRDNAEDLGITKCIWVHMPGQYTSRQTHKKFDGQVFDTKTGLYDSDVGRNVLPGELPYCRCVARMVLPEGLYD